MVQFKYCSKSKNKEICFNFYLKNNSIQRKYLPWYLFFKMQRKTFLQTIMGGTAIVGLSSLKWMIDEEVNSPKMPVLFLGHGSPMNAIEDNVYTKNWQELSNKVEKPKAIICISAHWLTKGSYVTHVEKPSTIHDFGGFPQSLFDVQYPAPGAPDLAKETSLLFPKNVLKLYEEWGLDHGTWSILKRMYPLADVPVFQLSIDYGKPAAYHFELAQYFEKLRTKGVLIVGSGNMIHNLGMVAWDKMNEISYGYDWAIETNEIMKKKIIDRDFKAMMDYQNLSSGAKLTIPTPDHYYPLMCILGLAKKDEEITIFNAYTMAGSLSMTSVGIGLKN
jgi:4,5-DOPA dioxygenase extradiol